MILVTLLGMCRGVSSVYQGWLVKDKQGGDCIEQNAPGSVMSHTPTSPLKEAPIMAFVTYKKQKLLQREAGQEKGGVITGLSQWTIY